MKKDSRGKRNSGYPDGTLPLAFSEEGPPPTSRQTTEGGDPRSLDLAVYFNQPVTISASGMVSGRGLTGTVLAYNGTSGPATGSTTFTASASGESISFSITLTTFAEEGEPPPPPPPPGPEEVPPATMFVAQNGSDNTGDGTTGSPYGSVAKAVAEASNGEIIEIRASTPGGTWEFNGELTITRQFAIGNPITIRVREGDTFFVNPKTAVNCLRLSTSTSNRARSIVFDGSVGRFWLGDPSLWTPANGGTSNYVHNKTVGARPAPSYIKFKGLRFSGATGYPAVDVEDGYESIEFDGCQMLHHGRELAPSSNRGNGVVVVKGSGLKVTNNLFGPFAGGHNGFELRAHDGYAYMSGNIFEGFLFPDGTGYRAASISSGDGLEVRTPPYPSGNARQINDGDIVRKVGRSARATITVGMKLGAPRAIFRNGLVYKTTGNAPFSISDGAAETDNSCSNMRIYHNTVDDNRGIMRLDNGSSLTTVNFRDIRWLNNLFYDVDVNNHRNGADTGGWSDVAAIWSNRMGVQPLEGYPDHWLGMVWDGNIFHGKNRSVAVVLKSSSINPVTGAGREESIAGAKGRWPNVFLAGNREVSAGEVSFLDRAAGTFAGYRLAPGSAGIGEAVPLARVTANSTGATVTLTDSYWIYDGFCPGVDPDYIAFYDSTGTTLKGIRQVESVPSQTQAILASSIDVAVNDQVYLVLSDGVTVCRNVGAVQ